MPKTVQWDSTTGMQQGDQLSPILFVLWLQSAIDTISEIAELRQLWYLDHGVLCIPADIAEKAFLKLRLALQSIGLLPNLTKCVFV